MVIRMLVRWILGLYWGLYGENGEENGNYYSMLGLYWVIWRPCNVVPFWVQGGIMEKKMETTIVCWGYIGL